MPFSDSPINQDKTILTVAIEKVGYSPFYSIEDEKTKGFSIDVLNYIEANSHYDFEYIILPWPRALHFVEEGKIDLILTLFKTNAREQAYYFVEPAYGDEINQLFTLANNTIEFDGKLASLISYSIGTVREYSYGQYFDQASYLNKLPALTEDVLLKLLLGKRIDLLISNPLVFKEILVRESVSELVKPLEPHISITPVYMAITNKRADSKEIKDKLGALTKQLKNTPYYQELLKKYQINFK
ncbi:transporter substrate-binding domain-containing protein [Colwellia sp. 1_MG-2023]|uniref:substrate-binding periplasmic protein n=1 Tax=Colwellia sp. 1_MG-2023 TaxID=3062649 RepID=UPI0026E3F784|nr:transporter substrate-binding domain-containing protein [Colwellia sp. 1_MG-2023]MDO6444874.1 transporter substrate-binding domain-containing protein [Colwellia sp. 1_MG-2023]